MLPSKSPSPYADPTSLAASKYASPQSKAAQPATEPPALAFIRPAVETTIATRDQIAAANSMVASNVSVQNANVQLAIELGGALKKEVDGHTAKISHTVSSAVVNVRQLLDLIRKSTPAADLHAVDKMWTELEQLFAAANDAKAALPKFLEKQRNNMSLYHTSLLNETIRENLEELNVQHKKVNIQHNLILEQQQGFQEYKSQVEAKLEDLQQLHNRVSRLTLEKSNLRTEIDRYQIMLEKEISDKSNELEKAESLQKEHALLLASNAALQAENDTLRTTRDDTAKKLSTVDKTVTERFTAELEIQSEKLNKSNSKIATLDALVNTLKAREAVAKKEADKSKAEYSSTKKKYDQQSTEYAGASIQLKERAKEVASLASEIGNLRQENSVLKDRSRKIKELEGEIDKLSQNNSDLSLQVEVMTSKLLSATDDTAQAKRILASLAEMTKEMGQARSTIELLRADNDRLRNRVDSLEGQVTHKPSIATPDSDSLKDKVRELEEDLKKWNKLANESYKAYKALLPVVKQADKLRQDSLGKDVEINSLKAELTATKIAQPNGGSSDNSTKYWKDKYETLLAACDG